MRGPPPFHIHELLRRSQRQKGAISKVRSLSSENIHADISTHAMAQRRLETDTEDELHAPCQALITKLEKRVKELEDQRDRVHKTLAVGEVGGGTTNFATRSFDEQDAFQVPYKLQEKFLRTLCNDDTMPL